MRYKKFWITVLVIIIALISVYVLRFSIIRGAGNFLIRDEKPVPVQYACVLSGGAYDRGLFAAELYKQHTVKHIICTGGNISPDLMSWGLPILESTVTRHRLIGLGVDSSAISMIYAGTSTIEEADTLITYCKQQHIQEIAIISSCFHTRRVKHVFQHKFSAAGIKVHIYGAPSTVYHEDEWWKNEYGLLAVNNEYVKLIYYILKK